MSTVTFVTKCWGGDYKYMLSGGFEKKRDACEYPFDDELLMLNNGVPNDVVPSTKFKRTSKYSYSFDPYFNAEFDGGFSCTSDYVCYVQGDCITQGGDWITPAIQVLESEPDVMVVSPSSEVNTWHNNQGYDHYMSDQAFVARTADMKNPEVYTYPESHDPDYPEYAKGSFEARVGAYLKRTGLKRKVLPKFWCYHG